MPDHAGHLPPIQGDNGRSMAAGLAYRGFKPKTAGIRIITFRVTTRLQSKPLYLTTDIQRFGLYDWDVCMLFISTVDQPIERVTIQALDCC